MRIAIAGHGVEGKALFKYFAGKGHEISVLDTKEGNNYLDGLDKFDIVFRSPGIPYLKKEFLPVRKKLSSMTKYFFEHCPCPIVGVTGTKGKGTVSTLIYKMLQAAGKKVFLGGNIGKPCIEFLDELNADSIVVLELSSFQLEDLNKSPNIAVVLSVSPDHLDHHVDFQEYLNAKKNIAGFQTAGDLLIVDGDDENSPYFKEGSKGRIFEYSLSKDVKEGGFLKAGSLIIKKDAAGIMIGQENEVKLKGKHNLKNILAASIAASLLETPINVISETVKNFKGLPHRLQKVKEVGGVAFFDDSASTNPKTAIAAIKSFSGPLILIAGGSDKNTDFTELGKEIVARQNLKTVILMGETKTKIEKTIEQAAAKSGFRKQNAIEIISADSYQEAFMVAKLIAQPGDTVLLSPASASFDMFNNYEERGEIFRNFVEDIAG